VRENGVDDPAATEFRAVLLKNVNRLRKRIYYYGKKSEEEQFQEEREEEFDNVYATEDRHSHFKSQEQMNFEQAFQLQGKVQEVATLLAETSKRVILYEEAIIARLPRDMRGEVSNKGLGFLAERRKAWIQEDESHQPLVLPGFIPLQSNKEVLPPNWKRHWDEEGQVYYENIETQEVQWDPPLILQAAVKHDDIEEDTTPEVAV